MNMNRNPTVDELRKLIGACDDRAAHHVLWVAKDGEVHVSQVPKEESPNAFEERQADMQLRLETFQAGNEYVGPEAARDYEWMKQLFQALQGEWPKAKDKEQIEYVDQF